MFRLKYHSYDVACSFGVTKFAHVTNGLPDTNNNRHLTKNGRLPAVAPAEKILGGKV